MEMPRSFDRGTIAGQATIAGKDSWPASAVQVAEGAAGWNTRATPSIQ
jgi:hypothetical protein